MLKKIEEKQCSTFLHCKKKQFHRLNKGTRTQRQGETGGPELFLLSQICIINHSISTLECKKEIIHLDSSYEIFTMSLLILSEVVLHISTPIQELQNVSISFLSQTVAKYLSFPSQYWNSKTFARS